MLREHSEVAYWLNICVSNTSFQRSAIPHRLVSLSSGCVVGRSKCMLVEGVVVESCSEAPSAVFRSSTSSLSAASSSSFLRNFLASLLNLSDVHLFVSHGFLSFDRRISRYSTQNQYVVSMSIKRVPYLVLPDHAVSIVRLCLQMPRRKHLIAVQ